MSEVENEKPLISVVVPCRNESQYIERTINSLLRQSNIPGKIEIIVVDGESSDGTKEILEKIKLKDSRIKIISNPEKITPVAMNLGIKNALGEYVALMGAHTIYDQSYLSECLALFMIDPSIMCTGGPIINEGVTGFGEAAALAMSNPVGVGNAKHRFPEYEGFAEGAGFPVFKKEVFDKIGLYDEGMLKNQDDELNYRLTKQGFKVFLSPKAKSKYFVRTTPVELFKQYFNYGYWRVAVIKKHKLPVSIRQVVPALFLLSMLFFICLGIIINQLFVSLLIPLIYLLTILLFDIKIIIKNGIKTGALFSLAVVILHFSYATGFLSGLRLMLTKKIDVTTFII